MTSFLLILGKGDGVLSTKKMVPGFIGIRTYMKLPHTTDLEDVDLQLLESRLILELVTQLEHGLGQLQFERCPNEFVL